MGHLSLANETGFAFEPVFLTDEEGRPFLVAVLKATYSILDDGSLRLAEEQIPVNLAGEYSGEPGESSYRYEPEGAFTKPSTDVVLIGHAHARRFGETEVLVSLRIGSVGKTVRVTGDRHWEKTLGSISMTEPEPFEKIPLVWERSFGGWDRTHPDLNKHEFEPRNPVGTGFRSKYGYFQEGIRLPNIEDPRQPISKYGEASPPAGFGFTSPDWQPRAGFAGTYDDAWMEQRMPFLPADFDRRFFNSASPGLVAPDYLRGDEPVLIENATPGSRLSFALPGAPPPKCRVELKRADPSVLHTRLDTAIVNTDESLLFLIWRAGLPLRNGPEDVSSIQLEP